MRGGLESFVWKKRLLKILCGDTSADNDLKRRDVSLKTDREEVITHCFVNAERETGKSSVGIEE